MQPSQLNVFQGQVSQERTMTSFSIIMTSCTLESAQQQYKCNTELNLFSVTLHSACFSTAKKKIHCFFSRQLGGQSIVKEVQFIGHQIAGRVQINHETIQKEYEIFFTGQASELKQKLKSGSIGSVQAKVMLSQIFQVSCFASFNK